LGDKIREDLHNKRRSTFIFPWFVRSSQVRRPQIKISGQLFSVSAEIDQFGSHSKCTVPCYVYVLKDRR